MNDANYIIRGRLTTSASAISFAGLKIIAYRPYSYPSGGMQTFGSIIADASGTFTLKFSGLSIGSGPMDVYIAPIPELIAHEGFLGIQRIEMSILGLNYPKVHISSEEWRLNGGTYTKDIVVDIPTTLWRIWDWLSEEFSVTGFLRKRVDDILLPVPNASVVASDIDMLPNPIAEGVGNAVTNKDGSFKIDFRRIDFVIDYALYDQKSNKYGKEDWPDLIFYAVQMIDGKKTTIYEETPEKARPKSKWNEPYRILNADLITDQGIANDESFDESFDDNTLNLNFLLHGIGLVQPNSIKNGYANTGPLDLLPNWKDAPFGGTLHIKGQFNLKGTTKPPKYYQVLYAPWNSEKPDASAFQPILNESWTVCKFDPVKGWKPMVVEPKSIIVEREKEEKVYEIPDYRDITLTEKCHLISWSTARRDAGIARYPDGKYDIMVKAWDEDGNPVTIKTADQDRLTVMIDNTWPTAVLKSIGGIEILRTDEMTYTSKCPVFDKSLGKIDIVFEAKDKNNHFLMYELSFITGHNFCVDRVLKVYNGKTETKERFRVKTYHRKIGEQSPTLTADYDEEVVLGGFPAAGYLWDIGSKDVVECAYQARLVSWDRTINGYGSIHRVEDNMHFSIKA